MEKPDWITGGIVGWNEYNPFYHAWHWIDGEETQGFSKEWISERPELKRKVLDAWNKKFWIPLYTAVCGLSLPDYNASLLRAKGKIENVVSVYGTEFLADWYIASGGAIDVGEYLRRRGELGCSVPPSDIEEGLRILNAVPQENGTVPLPPVFPSLPSMKTPWGWVALGTLLIVGGVAAATVLLQPKKKTGSIRRRRR